MLDMRDVIVRCADCGHTASEEDFYHTYSTHDYILHCPSCGSDNIEDVRC